MYKHVKTGYKHIPPSEQPLQFQSRYFLNKPRIITSLHSHPNCIKNHIFLIISNVKRVTMHIYIICLIYQFYISNKKRAVEKHHELAWNAFKRTCHLPFRGFQVQADFVYFTCICTNRPNPRTPLFDLICATLTISHCHFSQGLWQWFIHCNNITCWKLSSACGIPSRKGNITKPILLGLWDLMESRAGF